MTTFWILVLLGGLFVIALILLSRQDANLRHSSLVPPKGRATMEDVERLVQAGHAIDAIRCYREIHNCGLAEAKEAVDQIHARLHPPP